MENFDGVGMLPTGQTSDGLHYSDWQDCSLVAVQRQKSGVLSETSRPDVRMVEK